MTSRDPELTKLLVQELQRHLAALEEEAEKPEIRELEPIRRAVHALKGSAGLAGEPELASVMQRHERRLREGEATALPDVIETIRSAIRRLSAGESAVLGHWPEPPGDLLPRPIEPLVRAQYVAEVTDRLSQIDEALGVGHDPIDAASDVYRHVHTMKGAASAAGDEPMAWFCHGLEERLRGGGTTKETALAVLQEVARYRAVLGGLLDDPDAALAALRGVPRRSSMRPPPKTSAWPEEEDATIRVPAQAVDRLLDRIGAVAVARERVAARVTGAGVHARALRRLRGDLAEALRLIGPPRPWGAPAAALRRIERAASTLAQIGEELDQVGDQLSQSDNTLKESTTQAKRLLSAMRQTPIRGMFSRLAQAAQAEAKRTGRQLLVRSVGADETIDRRLAEQLVEPCLQLTRNAVAHGIELPDERQAKGKPRDATITFTAKKQGSRLVLTIADDGAGVDVSAVRARAVESGVVTDVLADAADDQTLLELLFLPGFSTRGHSPDLLAGRGIGLDITLAAVQKLGGTIRLASQRGQGFMARVDVPVESGLATVLWVRAGGLEHALPAAHARRVRMNDGADAERVPHLASCLEPRGPERAPLVLEIEVGVDATEPILVGVDAVGSTEEVLVRELSPMLRGMGPYAGAVVRGDGSLRLALDVHALAPRARALFRVPDARPSDRPPLSRR